MLGGAQLKVTAKCGGPVSHGGNPKIQLIITMIMRGFTKSMIWPCSKGHSLKSVQTAVDQSAMEATPRYAWSYHDHERFHKLYDFFEQVYDFPDCITPLTDHLPACIAAICLNNSCHTINAPTRMLIQGVPSFRIQQILINKSCIGGEADEYIRPGIRAIM